MNMVHYDLIGLATMQWRILLEGVNELIVI